MMNFEQLQAGYRIVTAPIKAVHVVELQVLEVNAVGGRRP